MVDKISNEVVVQIGSHQISAGCKYRFLVDRS